MPVIRAENWLLIWKWAFKRKKRTRLPKQGTEQGTSHPQEHSGRGEQQAHSLFLAADLSRMPGEQDKAQGRILQVMSLAQLQPTGAEPLL